MKFGRNVSVNYFGSVYNQPKKIHQESPSNHVETLEKQSVDSKIYKEISNQLETMDNKKQNLKNTKRSSNPLIAIMAVSSISRYLMSLLYRYEEKVEE